MENKIKICKLLLPLLQATRAGEDIESLTYFTNQNNEFICIKFKTGYKRNVNITADSGIAIIIDVLKYI